jgi:hypothetical protein
MSAPGSRDRSLCSGFRLRAQTPARRLNLLKRFAASTLEIFQSEYIPRRHCSPVGGHEGGEGKWVGPVLSVSWFSLRLFFSW